MYLQRTLLLLLCVCTCESKQFQNQEASRDLASLRDVGLTASSQIENGGFEDDSIDTLCRDVGHSNDRLSKWTVVPHPLVCDLSQNETNTPGVYLLRNDQTEGWGGVHSEDGSHFIALLGRKSMAAQTISGLKPGVVYQTNFKSRSHPAQEVANIRVGLWHFGQPNLENGDFETNAHQVDSHVDRDIPGWSSSSNGATFLVRSENVGLSSQDGDVHVALQQQGALVRQEIQVIPSVKYMLSFRAASHLGDMAVLRAQVTLAEGNAAVHKTLSAGNDAGLKSSFQDYELSFTALNSNAVIEFENVSPTTANLTVFIDAIKVSTDPWVLNEERIADFGPLNLIGNGNFEAEAVTGSELTDRHIPGWESAGKTTLLSSVLGVSGDVFSPDGIVFVGLESIEPNSDTESVDSVSESGAIRQHVHGLVPEMSYTLKFHALRNSQQVSLRVRVTEVDRGGPASVVMVERLLGVSDLKETFSEFELLFTATATSVMVSFENLASGSDSMACIDGIRLTSSDASPQDSSRERRVSVARSATNRLQNGDFEATAHTVRKPGFAYRPLPGWESAGRTAVVSNGNAAWGSVSSHDGAVYAALEGGADDSGEASLSQHVYGLVPGLPHTLTFQAASHPHQTAAEALIVRVTEHYLNGSSSVLVEMTQQDIPVAVATEGFDEFAVTFTTSTGSVSVRFEHVAPIGAVDSSVFIDAVSLMLDPRFVERITSPPAIIIDGDFEATVPVGGIPNGWIDAAFRDWKPTGTLYHVTNGNTEWGGLDSGDGSAYLALTGSTVVTKTAVSQTISNLVPRGRYTVVFLAASRPNTPLSSLRVRVLTPQAVLVSAVFEDIDPWFQEYTVSFTSSGSPEVEIEFENMDSASQYTVFVDAVSVRGHECDWESAHLSTSEFEDQSFAFVAPSSGQVTLVFRPSRDEDGIKTDMCAGPEGPDSAEVDIRDAIFMDSVSITEANNVRNCPAGWVQHGRWCKNTNECQQGLHNCHEHAACSDTDGSFTCTCDDGWVGNGLWCSWDDGIATESEDGWVKILEDATIAGYPEFPEEGVEGFSQPVSAQNGPMGKRGKFFKPLTHGNFRKIKAVYKAGFIGCQGSCVEWSQCIPEMDLLSTPWCACQRIPLEDRRDMPVFGLVLCPDNNCNAESPQTPIVSSQNLFKCKVTGAADLICDVDLELQPESEETLITVVPHLQGAYRKGFMQTDGSGTILFDLWGLPRYCDGDDSGSTDLDSSTTGIESQPSYINLTNSDFEASCVFSTGDLCQSLPGRTSVGNVRMAASPEWELVSGDGSHFIVVESQYFGHISSISQTVNGLIPLTEYSLKFLIASPPGVRGGYGAADIADGKLGRADLTITDPESGVVILAKVLHNLDNTQFLEVELGFTAVGSRAAITFANYGGLVGGTHFYLDRISLSVRTPDASPSSACEEAPIIPPRITTASIEQSSSVSDANNMIFVTIQLNIAVSSQTVGSFAISGLSGARVPSGIVPLRPITASSVFCVDGAPNRGSWTPETETLTLTLCSGISVSEVVFSFEVTNPETAQDPPAIMITALHPSTGAEVIPPTLLSTPSATAAEAQSSEAAALFVKQPELKTSQMWLGLHPLTQLATLSAVLKVNVALRQPDVITIALDGLTLGPVDVDVPLDGWGSILPFCTASGSQSSGWWDSANAQLVLSLCATDTLPPDTQITFSAVVGTADVAAGGLAERVFNVTAGATSHFIATAQVPASRFPVLGVSSQDPDMLRALMPALPPGTSLWFGPGLHTACDLTLTSNSVALQGVAATWDCIHGARHLTVIADEVSVQGLRFVRGASASNGGSLRLEVGRARIEDCDFEHNSAENGGAIFSAGILVMSGQNRLLSNVAESSGGAVFLGPGGSLLLESGASTFQLNRAVMGGAVYGSEFSVIRLSGTETTAPVLKSNLADSHGGGIFLGAYSQLTLACGVAFANAQP